MADERIAAPEAVVPERVKGREAELNSGPRSGCDSGASKSREHELTPDSRSAERSLALLRSLPREYGGLAPGGFALTGVAGLEDRHDESPPLLPCDHLGAGGLTRSNNGNRDTR